MHVHVACANGEAKFWLEPKVELARNYRLTRSQIKQAEGKIQAHYDELCTAWRRHFRP